MRKLILLLLLLLSEKTLKAQQETDAVCHVMYLKGKIWKGDSLLHKGDTIIYRNIQYLKFMDDVSIVTLFHPSLGNFRLTRKEMLGASNHESFFHFIQHLIKIKGRKISLSNRGDCLCITAESCFQTDTAINNKILLLDSMSFMADPTVYEARTARYFLQFKRTGNLVQLNGRTYTRRLNIENGNVQIHDYDIALPDTLQYNQETDEVQLCLFTETEGQRASKLIATMKFIVLPAEEIESYYRLLKEQLPAKPEQELFDMFCMDLYVDFGKPELCHLKKVIKYTN